MFPGKPRYLNKVKMDGTVSSTPLKGAFSFNKKKGR